MKYQQFVVPRGSSVHKWWKRQEGYSRGVIHSFIHIRLLRLSDIPRRPVTADIMETVVKTR